jgi:hypothetical protein
VSAGTPVLTGGTPSPQVNGYFDLAAAAGEVNSSGVATANGGIWPVPAATYTGQILTGTPTATSLPVSGASYPVYGASSPGLLGQAIVMTSGAANGQVAIISSNTATGITLYANGANGPSQVAVLGLTVAPSAGDTFSIIPVNTPDGIHPSYSANATIVSGAGSATGFQAWIAATAVPFGAMLGAASGN